jgi:hypothetical protein
MVGALLGSGISRACFSLPAAAVIGFTHTMAEHLAACPQLQRQAIFFVLEFCARRL